MRLMQFLRTLLDAIDDASDAILVKSVVRSSFMPFL
jgi:hypothetical protein